MNARIQNSQCSSPCPGYPPEICGGLDVYSVYAIDPEDDSESEYEDEKGIIVPEAWTAADDAANRPGVGAWGWIGAVQNFFSACLGRQASNGEKPPKQAMLMVQQMLHVKI